MCILPTISTLFEFELNYFKKSGRGVERIRTSLEMNLQQKNGHNHNNNINNNNNNYYYYNYTNNYFNNDKRTCSYVMNVFDSFP